MSKNLYRSFLKNTEKSGKEKEIECIIITTITRDLALKEKRRIEKGKKKRKRTTKNPVPDKVYLRAWSFPFEGLVSGLNSGLTKPTCFSSSSPSSVDDEG